MKNSASVIFSLSLVILILTSCSPPNEKAHPIFQKAEKAFKDGEFQKAAEGYQEYLDFNRKSKITHYKLAGMYRDYLENPFLAAYHYQRYLVYDPDSPDKEAIDTWIASSEKLFAKKIQQKYPEDFPSVTELKKLREDKARLVNYAIKMKKQNAALLKKVRGESTTPATSEGEKTDLVAGEGMQEVYTVIPGDNLQKISRKLYGTSKHYRIIFEANKNIMKSESQLAVGQKLQIPKLKKVSDTTESKENIPEKNEDDTGLITDFP